MTGRQETDLTKHTEDYIHEEKQGLESRQANIKKAIYIHNKDAWRR